MINEDEHSCHVKTEHDDCQKSVKRNQSSLVHRAKDTVPQEGTIILSSIGKPCHQYFPYRVRCSNRFVEKNKDIDLKCNEYDDIVKRINSTSQHYLTSAIPQQINEVSSKVKTGNHLATKISLPSCSMMNHNESKQPSCYANSDKTHTLNSRESNHDEQNYSNQNNSRSHRDVEANHMPPLLCGNEITTPNLAIQFSPFLSFSEEKTTNSYIMSNQRNDVTSAPQTEEKDIYQTTRQKNDPTFTLSLTPPDEVDMNIIDTELTYADNLLLNASQIMRTSSTPTRLRVATPKISGRKRKDKSSCRASRQPQKRFSIDLEHNEIPGGDLFVSKRDGLVRLTTNLPRKVEALDPVTGQRTQLFASCSEASRVMGINRTRMSRSK